MNRIPTNIRILVVMSLAVAVILIAALMGNNTSPTSLTTTQPVAQAQTHMLATEPATDNLSAGTPVPVPASEPDYTPAPSAVTPPANG